MYPGRMDPAPALELAELLAVDVSSLALRERVEHQAALERVRNKLDAVLLAHMGEFSGSGAWQLDAASSAINWFQGQVGGARDVMEIGRASCREGGCQYV